LSEAFWLGEGAASGLTAATAGLILISARLMQAAHSIRFFNLTQPSPMHVKSLKVFCDVVGRRSFSRAADENGISQSGASQIVLHLEEHLGVRLLDRSKRPFALTPEGKVYYEGCRKLVHRLSALEEEVRTLHQEVEGRVSIASIYSIGLSHLRPKVDEFHEQHPKAKIAIEYHHPNRVYEMVDQDQVDLGLVSYPKSTRTISGTEWQREPYRLVCSPAHPLAGADSLSTNELSGMETVGFDLDLKVRHELDRELASRGVEVRVTAAFDNTETIKRAIEIGGGMGFLPDPIVAADVEKGTLQAIDVPGLQLERPIGVIKRRGVSLGKTARRFMQFILDDLSSDDSSPATATGVPDDSLESSAIKSNGSTQRERHTT